MTARMCKTCGVPLPEHAGRGRPREWCSAKCYGIERRRRSKLEPSARQCGHCGAEIKNRGGSARFCSLDCSYASRGLRLHAQQRPERPCAVCGKPFRPKSHDAAKYCSPQCRSRRSRPRTGRKRRYTDSDRARDQRKAAIRRGADTGRSVVLCEIGDRDGWRCELCRKPVDKWLDYPNPLSPSLDHIVPLSLGGIHDPANVRVTHLKCNVRRSNRIDGEQLPLAGLLEVL